MKQYFDFALILGQFMQKEGMEKVRKNSHFAPFRRKSGGFFCIDVE